MRELNVGSKSFTRVLVIDEQGQVFYKEVRNGNNKGNV